MPNVDHIDANKCFVSSLTDLRSKSSNGPVSQVGSAASCTAPTELRKRQWDDVIARTCARRRSPSLQKLIEFDAEPEHLPPTIHLD